MNGAASVKVLPAQEIGGGAARARRRDDGESGSEEDPDQDERTLASKDCTDSTSMNDGSGSALDEVLVIYAGAVSSRTAECMSSQPIDAVHIELSLKASGYEDRPVDDGTEPVCVPGRLQHDAMDDEVEPSSSAKEVAGVDSGHHSEKQTSPPPSTQPSARSRTRHSRLDDLVLPAAKSTRANIYQALRQPAEIINQLGPHATQMSTYVARTATSFHKKALKRNVLKVTEHSHLKLDTLASSKINALHLIVHAMVIVVPLSQILYGFFCSPTAGPDSNQADLGDDGVWADATIQTTVLFASALFIRRILLYSRRQRIQIEILWLAGFASVFSLLSLISNAWNAMHPTAEISRELMTATNTLMAAQIYFLLTHFSDFYTDLVAGWSAIEHRTTKSAEKENIQWRWLQYISGKWFSHVVPVIILCYMGLRLALGWRNSVVFDFLPMTNVITPARLILVHGKSVQQSYLLLDSIVISVFDAVLLGFACYKSSCAHISFRHIFVQDFARIFTEFNIFVLYSRKIVLCITIGGHIAAWSAPFDRLFSPVDWDSETKTMRVIQMGAVQLQLGFLFCLSVWMVASMFYALPDDSMGLKGWVVGTNVIKHKHQHKQIKYFLYESDVYLKTKFCNLKDIEQIDPTHFIMARQIEAFNLAQLVYACGKHESAFKDPQLEVEHIQKLVSDPQFTIVEIIQDELTDTHCLILESLTTIVVAFRGTSSKKNARTDLNAVMSLHLTARQLDFSKVPSLTATLRRRNAASADALTYSTRTWLDWLLCKRNPPKAHSGFYAAYLSVEKRVLAKVKELYDHDPRKILATGHSLGGALAALCSFDIVGQLKIANVTCTTFGCPRIGNTSFKKKYNHAVPATFAFVNAADVVTKLPPKTPKALSYTSVGTIVLINSFGNLVIAPNVLELAVLHQGYSAKAHTLKAYHLSLLLWCLRSHKMQYHPRFWRQPREFLEANYGHLSEIQEYLKVSAAPVTPREKDPRRGRLRR